MSWTQSLGISALASAFGGSGLDAGGAFKQGRWHRDPERLRKGTMTPVGALARLATANAATATAAAADARSAAASTPMHSSIQS